MGVNVRFFITEFICRMEERHKIYVVRLGFIMQNDH